MAAQKETAALPEIMKKINEITEGCSKPYFYKALTRMTRTSIENSDTICEYIQAEQTEINLKNSTKEGKIKVLLWLSVFLGNKSFQQMTKQDILFYLDNLRRPLSEDPSQRRIGSYNSRQMILNKFFR